MARRIIYLVEMQPYDPVGAATVNVNFSDNLTDSAELGTTLPYHVRLTQSFNTEVGVFDDNVPGGTTVAVGSISLLNTDGAFDYLLGYAWDKRSVIVKKGYEGDAYAAYTTIFTGTSLEASVSGSYLVIAIRDSSTALTDVFQPNKFLGTGGSEGFSDLAGKRKPLCYGRVRNLLPVAVDSALLVLQVHDGAVENVQAVYDRGNKLTCSQNYASYAALTSATIEPGFYATYRAGGFIRLGAKPAGTLTADVDGEFYAATVNNLPQLVNLVLQNKSLISSTAIDQTSVTAFAADVPYAFEGLYISEPDIMIQDFVETAVASMNGFWYVNSAGKIVLKQFKFRSPVASVRQEDLAEIRREQSPAALFRTTINYAKNPTVQSLSEFPVPRGTLNGYLTDNIVYIPTNGSGGAGTYTYTGKFNAFFNDVDATSLGNVDFKKVTAASWLTLNADGTFTISDPGAASGTFTQYDISTLPTTFTNKALYSRQFENPVWVTNLATVTANTILAPDGIVSGGSNTGDRVDITASASSSMKQTVTGGSSTLRQFSVFVRSHAGSTPQPFRLFIQEGAGTITRSAVFSATGNWQRFTVTATFSSGSANASFGFVPDTVPTAAALGVWQADYFEGYNLPDGGPNIETTSAPRTLADQGNGGFSFPIAETSAVTLEARVGEFAVDQDFTLRKRLSPATSTLVVTPSVRRFYFDNNGSQSTPSQTSVITATGSGLGTLVFSAVTNTGATVTLTGSGSTRTLAASDLPLSALVMHVIVSVVDTTNNISNFTKIIVQRGEDAYLASALGALAAANSSITLYYQISTPTGGTLNDLWIDTDDSNKLYRYNGTSWVLSSDTRIAQALTDAAGAQATADGKIKTYLNTSAPTGTFALGDLWYNPTTQELKRWNGSGWSDIVSTVGAQIGTNLSNSGANVTAPQVLNSAVTISSGGVLSGAGGGTVTIAGIAPALDPNASLTDNLFRNSQFLVDTSFWTLAVTSGTMARSAGTSALPPRLHMTGSNTLLTSESRPLPAGARKLFISLDQYRTKLANQSDMYIIHAVNFFDALGTFISQAAFNDYGDAQNGFAHFVGGIVQHNNVNTWETAVNSCAVPINATSVNYQVSFFVNAGEYTEITNLRLSPTSPAADITVLNPIVQSAEKNASASDNLLKNTLFQQVDSVGNTLFWSLGGGMTIRTYSAAGDPPKYLRCTTGGTYFYTNVTPTSPLGHTSFPGGPKKFFLSCMIRSDTSPGLGYISLAIYLYRAGNFVTSSGWSLQVTALNTWQEYAGTLDLSAYDFDTIQVFGGAIIGGNYDLANLRLAFTERSATLGAAIGTNLTNGGSTVTAPQVLNSAVTIGSDGTLAGAGGGQVTIGGLAPLIDPSATMGDNVVRNYQFLTNATYWTLSGSLARLAGTSALPPRLNFTTSSDILTSEIRALPPGTRRLFFSYDLKRSNAGTSINNNIYFYDVFTTQISAPTIVDTGTNTSGTTSSLAWTKTHYQGGAVVTGISGAWETVVIAIDTPIHATQIIVQLQSTLSAGQTDEITNIRVSPTAPGATLGAVAGANLQDSGFQVLTDANIKNSAVSISAGGALSGAGGGTVTYGGLGGGAVGQQADLRFGGLYLKDSAGSVLGDSAVKNSAVTITSGGALTGAGGGTVTYSGLGGGNVGLQSDLRLNGLYLKDSAGSTLNDSTVKNSAVTISSGGALAGAGGGTVTIGGLGYNGDLFATRNRIAIQSSDPGYTEDGAFWGDTTNAMTTLKQRLGGTWSISATYGSRAGTNLYDSSLSSLGDSAVKNTAVSISSGGVLSGAGGGTVTFGGLGGGNVGLQSDLRLNGLYLKDSAGSTLNDSTVKNSSVSISSAGVLSGAGGGTVTMPGLASSTYPWAIFTDKTPAALSRDTVNLFPYPRGTDDGRTPAQLGWINTVIGSGFSNLVIGHTEWIGGGYYQTIRTSGGAVTIVPYYDTVWGSGGGPTISASCFGYAGNGTFSPYIEFWNAARTSVLGSAVITAYNPTSDRWECTAVVPSSTAFIRFVARGIFASTSGTQQDMTFNQIKIESNGAATTYSEPPDMLSQAGGYRRLTDGRNLPSNRSYGIRSLYSAPSMTDTWVAGSPNTVTINLGAATFESDAGVTVTLASADIPGCVPGTSYYLYFTAIDPASNAGFYSASTTIINVLNPSRIYIGLWLTRATAGDSGGGAVPGDTNCVLAEAFIPTDSGVMRARELRADQRVLALEETKRESYHPIPVESNSVATSLCVTLTSESGISLTCARTTPVTLRDGSGILAPDSLGHDLPVLDEKGFRWEVIIEVSDAGAKEVAHVRCHQRVYAAGNETGRYIFTHNPLDYSKP